MTGPYTAEIVRLLRAPELPLEDVLGVHVTSAQAIGSMAATGRLPITGVSADRVFFAAPIDETGSLTSVEAAREFAQWFGIANARTQHILEQYPALRAADKMRLHNLMLAVSMDALCQVGTLPNEQVEALIRREFAINGSREALSCLGMTEQEEIDLLLQSESCRGVALTLPRRLAEVYNVAGGDNPEQPFDYDIRAIGGLPLSDIARIELLGPYEVNWLAAKGILE